MGCITIDLDRYYFDAILQRFTRAGVIGDDEGVTWHLHPALRRRGHSGAVRQMKWFVSAPASLLGDEQAVIRAGS
jgi:hypothetical protein